MLLPFFTALRDAKVPVSMKEWLHLMEAMDRNSAIRTQTGLTFNEAIHGVSFLTQAFNLPNLAAASMSSQGTRGVTLPTSARGQARPRQTINLCPAGMTGEGTAASPCVAAGCSTTPRISSAARRRCPI